MLQRPLITLERVRVCKRDGHALAEPQGLPGTDASGLGVWQKLMVFAGEQARGRWTPVAPSADPGASPRPAPLGPPAFEGSGATTASTRPHGDSFWQLRRRVPVVTVIVDTPERTATWYALVDDLTQQTGLGDQRDRPGVPRHQPDVDPRRAQARPPGWQSVRARNARSSFAHPERPLEVSRRSPRCPCA